MKSCHTLIHLATLIGLTASVCGQVAVKSSQTSSTDALQDLKPGVVVEEVKKNSAADQARIQAGDVILSWSRGDAKGQIESPFDVSLIEIEQGPRGAVTLAGLSGEDRRTWVVLGPETWGLKTRPNLQRTLLDPYFEGQELAKAGKLAQAVEHWRVEEQDLRTPWLRSWFLFHMAGVLDDAQQWQEADHAYQEAVDVEAGAEPAVEEQILLTWGDRFFQRNDTDGAERRYREALAESRRLGNENLAMAASLHELGLVFRKRHDLNNAQEYFKQSLAIKERSAPGSLTVSDTLQFLGRGAMSRGDLAAAEAYLLRALTIAEQLAPGTERMATDLWFLGSIGGQRFNLAEAERYLRRAVALEGKVAPGSGAFGSMLGALGSVLFERGDLAKAEEYYLKSLSIASSVAPDSSSVAATLNNLGNVALERGDLVKAEDYYRRSLVINEKINHEGLTVANNLNSLGDVFRERGNFAAAAKFYEQALAIRARLARGSLEAAESLHSLADAERGLGELTNAEEYYRQALEIRQTLAPGTTLQADTLAALARIMQLNQQPDAAAQLFEQALNALESQTARLGGGQDIRSGFRAKFDVYYREYVDLLITQKQPELAFQVLERSRARSLLEMLAEAHVDIHKGVDSGLLELERRLQGEIAAKTNQRISLLTEKHAEHQVAAVAKEIEDLVSRYQEAEGQIRISSPGYAALTQSRSLSAKEVQEQLLDNDTLLLEYSLGEERSYLFALTSSSLNSYELPKRAEIESKTRSLYDLLTERDRPIPGESARARQTRISKAEAEYRDGASALSQILLGPVAALLAQKRLLIVSDGALHYVPFAALPVPRMSGQDSSSTPLMVDHEIVNLPSASTLAVLRHEQADRKQPTKQVVVLADPVFDNQDTRVRSRGGPNWSKGKQMSKDDNEAGLSNLLSMRQLTRSAADLDLAPTGELHLPRLPFTRDEAKAILAVVPPGAGKEALDFHASRKLAVSGELTKYQVVHFATHALIDNVHPELSGLVLSLVDQQGAPQDGFLDLQDIYDLDLSADLVVLSACQTGLGKEINGEGMIGLTRGFMYAGASSVMATLWKVDDFATAKLMGHFYRAMKRGRMRPAQALRQAQLTLWKEDRWSAPYYWAGFTLQGEWK